MSAAYGNTPKHGVPVSCSSSSHTFIEQRDVTTKLVDGESAKQRALFRRQEMRRADDRREHAAALDIGHENPRRLNARHQTEIDQVVLAQIQLGDAARAFDDDRVEATRPDRR